MRPLIVIRNVPKIDFMRWHVFGFAFSLALTALTIGIFATAGLNYGIDFVGGMLIEARTPGPADLAACGQARCAEARRSLAAAVRQRTTC
jgi:preprotein translocase subunit SecF